MVHKQKTFLCKLVYRIIFFIKSGISFNFVQFIFHLNIFNRTLADLDKDGRLTADEFVIAMHCCDIARTGQTLPGSVPNEWLPTNTMQSDRSSKSNDIPTYAQLNQQLKETINQTETSAEAAEAEKKQTIQTYEEKRQRNYEVRR